VFLFTHPLISWLSRKKAFGSARFTGLNAVRDGGVAPPAHDEVPRTRTKRARTSTSPARTGTAPVALLEREDEPDAVEPLEPDVLSEPEPEPELTEGEAESEASAEQASTARRRTAPEQGSAAERAAARRARIRSQADEKGTS